MRHSRPPAYQVDHEEEDDTMEPADNKKDEAADEGGGGPKSLMSIRIAKDVKETVKTQIFSKSPQLMAPLGMGMGPRFHTLRGVRPGGPGPPPPPSGVGVGPPPPLHGRPTILPTPTNTPKM